MSAARLVFSAGGWPLAVALEHIEAVRDRRPVSPLPGAGVVVRGLAVVDGSTRLVVEAAAWIAAPARGPQPASDGAALWVLLGGHSSGIVLEIPSPIAFMPAGAGAPRPDLLSRLCDRAEADGAGSVVSLISPRRLRAALRHAGGPLLAGARPAPTLGLRS